MPSAWGFLVTRRGVRRSRPWPVASGKVETCSVESGSDSDGGTTYEVKVRYKYSVGGNEFTGTRLAFGYAASNGQEGHAITWLAFVVGFTVIWWVASRSDDVLLQNLMVR
jgi:hypothetical protein